MHQHGLTFPVLSDPGRMVKTIEQRPTPEPPIIFELCAETAEACQIGQANGVHRIELCGRLEVGGLTPDPRLVQEVVRHSAIPVHVMLRPRPGGFVYTEVEFSAIQASLRKIRELGIGGVVFGLLHSDRTVDLKRTRLFVEAAAPLATTFHRAFDETLDLDRALDDVITAGCDRILTSGGAADVAAGATSIARLVQRAAGRIEIAAGGGLRIANAKEVARISKARHFHGSLRRSPTDPVIHPEDVVALLEALSSAH